MRHIKALKHMELRDADTLLMYHITQRCPLIVNTWFRLVKCFLKLMHVMT